MKPLKSKKNIRRQFLYYWGAEDLSKNDIIAKTDIHDKIKVKTSEWKWQSLKVKWGKLLHIYDKELLRSG